MRKHFDDERVYNFFFFGAIDFLVEHSFKQGVKEIFLVTLSSRILCQHSWCERSDA